MGDNDINHIHEKHNYEWMKYKYEKKHMLLFKL